MIQLIILICCVLMFFPFIFNISTNNVDDDFPLINALSDRYYNFMLALSIGGCLPYLIDMLYDYYKHFIGGIKLHKNLTDQQWYFVISYFVPNILIFLNVVPRMYFECLPILYCLKIMSIYLALSMNIINYGKNFFRKIYFPLIPLYYIDK